MPFGTSFLALALLGSLKDDTKSGNEHRNKTDF